jgi:hypothetical protein
MPGQLLNTLRGHLQRVLGRLDDGLTSLDRYKGRCYDIELAPDEDNQYIAYVAYNSQPFMRWMG